MISFGITSIKPPLLEMVRFLNRPPLDTKRRPPLDTGHFKDVFERRPPLDTRRRAGLDTRCRKLPSEGRLPGAFFGWMQVLRKADFCSEE
jgi:hypothetical protein